MGDRILKVNGTDVTKATHQEAVMELLRPGDSITLTIQHDPLPDSYQVSSKITIFPESKMITTKLGQPSTNRKPGHRVKNDY